MPGATSHGMDYHHSYGGMNGHGGGYGYGARNGFGGPEIDQHSMDRFEPNRDGEATIDLDHLATYSSKSGVMKPEDGLRKLRGMESTTGIWTMRCVMIIERKNLVVIDKGNGDELERFPLELVHDPTAIFKEDRREVYTNLILFSVLDQPGKYNGRCDMHIFQSIRVPAQEIVDEILAAKEGRPSRNISSIPPPPMGPAPDPPGGRWLGGPKEPKPHFSYSTDPREEEPIIVRRDNVINIPGEKHVIIERGDHDQHRFDRNGTPVQEQFVKERYIPLGSDSREKQEAQNEERFVKEKYVPLGSNTRESNINLQHENSRYLQQENDRNLKYEAPRSTLTKEKFTPVEINNREPMPTPPIRRRLFEDKRTPYEEIRQKNAFSSIPIKKDLGDKHFMSQEDISREFGIQSLHENSPQGRHTPLQENREFNRNPHVKEHFVERRFIPSASTERRSSLGSRSYGGQSDGFDTSGIEEEEFDIPEKLLSRTSRRDSGDSSHYRSSSVDRYTLPGSPSKSVSTGLYYSNQRSRSNSTDLYATSGSHGNRFSNDNSFSGSHSNSMTSDLYAVPYESRSSDRYSFGTKERRASTGGLDLPQYSQPRSRLSTSSVTFNDVPIHYERSMPYRSETDIQAAIRRERERELAIENKPTSKKKGLKRWMFGKKRQQMTSSSQGSSSGYSSMEPFRRPQLSLSDQEYSSGYSDPSIHYSTMPKPKTKSKQSSRYHYKSTTRDEVSKSNNQAYSSQNEGFRVIPVDGGRYSSEGFRATESPKDIYSLPKKDSMDSRGYGVPRDNRASYHESSGQNETLERDVQFLNCCFDDIEKFVARLQAAAEAYKQLESRRHERQQHRKKHDKGPPKQDGMLSMRARPPPADDFIDIFQKIKWAFNLLAKLKAHIHDPNAPELVHFIFTPLSLIYEASRDPVHQGVDLASKAVSPLLTREAKELLLNCLTSKELELWQVLGRNWTTSEDEYPGHVEAFHARFYNGWTPSPPAVARDTRPFPSPRDPPENGYKSYGRTQPEEPQYIRNTRREDSPYTQHINSSFRPEEESPYRPEPLYERKLPTTPPPGAVTNQEPTKYQGYIDKHVDRNLEPQRNYQKSRAQENAEFKDELRRKNAKIYEAVHERTGRNVKEITVDKGDILEVLDDSRNWWRLRNCKGETGYAPYTILREVGDDRNDVDRSGHRRGSIGGYSGNINQSNHHIPVAPPPPRKDEEVFERRIKISSPTTKDSDDNERYRQKHKRSSGSRDLTPDSSDGDNFSGSYDGRSNNSIEDQVERRRRNRGSSERPKTYHDNRPRHSGAYHNQSFEEDTSRQNTRTPPTPPSFVPPPPPDNRPPTSSKPYSYPGKIDRRQEHDDLQNELSQRLTGKPMSKARAPNHVIHLSTKSTPNEVVEWLISKSFSQKCLNALRRMNGSELLKSKRKDLERLVGHDEAQRLDGHLTLLKNKTGYKTQGPRELQAILQQRKQMAETYNDDVGHPPSFAPDSPDYSDDNSEDSEEDFGDAGKTLRALLQHQRKKITNYKYEQ